MKIEESEFNELIHSLIRIASILRAVENGALTDGQRQILKGCEIRLNEIRQRTLESVKEDNYEMDKSI